MLTFLPQKAVIMKLDTKSVIEAFATILFLSSQELNQLIAELPATWDREISYMSSTMLYADFC